MVLNYYGKKNKIFLTFFPEKKYKCKKMVGKKRKLYKTCLSTFYRDDYRNNLSDDERSNAKKVILQMEL